MELSNEMRARNYEILTAEKIRGYSSDYLRILENELREAISTLNIRKPEDRKEIKIHQHELENVKAELNKRKRFTP